MVFRMVQSLFSVAVLAAISLSIGPNGAAAQRSLTLEDLTVPPDHLAAGCSLGRTSSIGLRIPSNPWVGTDRPLAAAIVERVGPAPSLPDGPPLSGPQLARFRLQLADDVEQAYAAVFEAEAESVVVYGLRFPTTASSAEFFHNAQRYENPRVMQIAFGLIVVVVHGGSGLCAQAVRTHISSLAQ
jgi:hypothetical protein